MDMQQFYQQLDQFYTQGNPDGAERFLLSQAGSSCCAPADPHLLLAVHNELGSLYRGQSQFQPSLSAFEKARELAASLYGADSLQYATVLNNMAGTYRLSGVLPQAIQLFLQSLELYRECGEEDSYLYASGLNNLSLAYQQDRQFQPAIQCLEQALQIMQRLPQHQQELAITYNNLTALYFTVGDQEKASQCAEQALAEFDKCADGDNLHYAAGLNSLASCLYAAGDLERALTTFQKSARYTVRYFGENIEYAITCQNMRWVHEKLGQYPQAIAALERAVSVYQHLLGADHERTLAAQQDLTQLREVHPG